jgi:hypothetical protein
MKDDGRLRRKRLKRANGDCSMRYRPHCSQGHGLILRKSQLLLALIAATDYELILLSSCSNACRWHAVDLDSIRTGLANNYGAALPGDGR